VTAGAEGETAVSEPVTEPDGPPEDGGPPAPSDAADEGGAAETGEPDLPTEADTGPVVAGPADPGRSGSALFTAAPAPAPSAAAPVAPPPEPARVLEGPPSARLAQLGISLPAAPAPVAAYVPAVRSGDLVFTSGQLPFVDGALPLTGVVGDLAVDVTPAEAVDLARRCAVNALAAVAGVVELDRVERVVKVVVYVASAPGYSGQPEVANGASTLLEQVFGEAGRHARSAVGVSALPLRSPVEVEVVVQVAAAS
jgi:enamine deaminase RidA (YjgF/YER057c/UK114 family)